MPTMSSTTKVPTITFAEGVLEHMAAMHTPEEFQQLMDQIARQHKNPQAYASSVISPEALMDMSAAERQYINDEMDKMTFEQQAPIVLQ